MEGEFKIKVGRSIYTYTNFDDIPKEIGVLFHLILNIQKNLIQKKNIS